MQSAGRRADRYRGRGVETFFRHEKGFHEEVGENDTDSLTSHSRRVPGALCSESPASAGHSFSEGR